MGLVRDKVINHLYSKNPEIIYISIAKFLNMNFFYLKSDGATMNEVKHLRFPFCPRYVDSLVPHGNQVTSFFQHLAD